MEMDKHQDSQVKGVKNFNFLKDNTFLNSRNDCSEMYSDSEIRFQHNSETDFCSLSSPSDGEDDVNGVQGKLETDSDFKCGKGELIEKNSLKEMGNNSLVEKEKNTNVIQIEDEEKVESYKKEEIEESGGKNEKIGENNDEKVDNIKKDVVVENREEKYENALLFDENKRMEDVKNVGTKEDVQKKLHNKISSVNEKNEAREENTEVEGSKEKNKNYEELLLSLDKSLEINERELLQDGDQKYDEMLTEKELEEMENVFSPDCLEEEEMLLKDEKNAKKVIDDKLAAFFGHKSLKDGTLCTSSTFGASSTPHAKREKNWSSTPFSKPLSQNTPFSNSTSYCTPAKTVLKNWKPSALRRSKLFASNAELNRASLDAATDKCSTILEDNEEEDDVDGDDFDTSLIKLEQMLAGIENNQEMSPSDVSKTFSKIEAYHKTIVAERTEDCQKLEEVMTELSSQLFSDVQKGLSLGSQDESSIIGEDEEEDFVMKEFLGGRNVGLMVVEDIDFANEQNDTVIEMKDEAGKQDEDNEGDMMRLTCSDISGLNSSGATLSSDIDKSGTASNSDFAKSEPTTKSDVVKFEPIPRPHFVGFSSPDPDVESTSSDVSKWSTLSGNTSSNATMSGSLSSDVSCSSLSVDSVKLVLDTSLDSDNVKYGPIPVVVLEPISTPGIKELATSNVVTSTDPEPKSTSSSNVVATSSAEPLPESTSSVDPLPKSTSSSDVVKSKNLNTLSKKSKADVKKEVASKVFPTNSSRIDPAQELKPYSDSSLQRDYSTSPDDEFYSDDPLENLDNYNPNWAILKNLTNDRDRYREISKRWRNMSIPNPNENLTFLKCLEDARIRASNYVADSLNGFNGNKNKKTRRGKNKKRKFQEAFEPTNQFVNPGDEPPAKRQKCTIATEIFDNEINKLLKTFECRRYALQTQLTAELRLTAVRQEREMFDCVYKYHGNHQELQFLQIKEVESLTSHFQQKLLEAEKETSDLVCRLRMSIEEVKTFHAFYDDLQDDNGESQFITKNQLDELLETEFMISTYMQRYGE